MTVALPFVPLPVLLNRIDRGCLAEGLRLLPLRLTSLRARAQLLKIGLQESRLAIRDQIDRAHILGPAVGLWQFERSGIKGVLRHPATGRLAQAACTARHVPATVEDVFRSLPKDDVLAAAFARLNLYWNQAPLPEIDDVMGSWTYYTECWKPGRPRPDTWPEFSAAVVAYLKDLP